jgi:ribosomal-protein-alanine N-acetyltransferase
MKPNLTLTQATLRPTVPGDLDRVCALLHHADVRRFLCDDTILPRDTVIEMLALSDRLDSRGYGLWAVEDGQHQLLGVAGLQPVSAELLVASGMADAIEPLIALHPDSWGRGIAGDAIAALIEHARRTCRLSRLVAAVDRPNERSHKLMRRCGFKPVDVAQGPAHELVLYGLDLTVED